MRRFFRKRLPAFLLTLVMVIMMALSILLIFIGSKMFIADMLGLAKIPPAVSLSITLAILTTGVVYSLIKTRKD